MATVRRRARRLNRGFRQKARQVGAFHSLTGVAAALGLVVAHRHRLDGPAPTAPWTAAIEEARFAA